MINEWSSHLPDDIQPGLRSRLPDRNSDANVSSALWELYLHEMLLGSGCTGEIEQALGSHGTERRSVLCVPKTPSVQIRRRILQESAQPLPSADPELGDRCLIGGRLWQWV